MDYLKEERGVSGEFNLPQMVVTVWRRRWWVVASVVLFTSLFGLLWFFSRPVYRATIILAPAGTEQSGLGASMSGALGNLGGLASLAGLDIGADATETEAALAVLRSREFTERFIRDNNLMPLLFESSWDAKARKWKNPEDPPTLARGCKAFNTSIRSLAQDKRTSLITMNIDWHNREQAAQWANELIERLNREMRERAITKATAAVGFLEAELQKTPLVGTQEAINRLIEVQIRHRMVASVTPEYTFRVVDRAQVPDRIDKVWPKGSILFPTGFLIGGFVGVFGVLLLARFAGLTSRSSHQE